MSLRSSECSWRASLSSLMMGRNSSASFVATALAHSSRIRLSKVTTTRPDVMNHDRPPRIARYRKHPTFGKMLVGLGVRVEMFSLPRTITPSLTSKQNGCFTFPFFCHSIKTVCGDQAPAGFQRIAERGFGGRCFGARIDHVGGGRRVFRPTRNEPPAHRRQFADGFLRILGDDRDRLAAAML